MASVPDTAGSTVSAKSVCIIGGASGIGLEAARFFVSGGAAVTIVDANAGSLEKAQAELAALGTVAGFAADVRDRQSIDDAMARGVSGNGGMDVFLFTAGVLLPGLLLDVSETDFDLTFDVNTKGFWNGVRAAMPYFPERGGSIVAVSSAAGQRPKAGNGAYAASKVALQFLVQTFALELASRGVRVNCVSPSTLQTPLTERFAATPAEGGYRPSSVPPLGRYCDVKDIVRAVAFLCSEDASFITGTTIAVDGGLMAGVPLPTS
ncbi:SDR family oxidoreductase [Microbaculum marinum]|uniref:SDR family oxidoreductase n=1 Tax=Microbaculum marinum TaxID=1764581 RepID=A0AAW9RXV6_9HYPH